MLLKTILLLVTLIAVGVNCDDDVMDDVLDGAKETYSDAKDVVQDTKDYVEGKNESASGNQTSTEENSPGVSRQQENGQVSNNNNKNQNVATGGSAMCRRCSVTKTMDNVVTVVYDDATGLTENSVYSCTNYQCGPSEDWCLVTYVYYRASGDDPERKMERYHCGNKEQIRTDDMCRDMYEEDRHTQHIGSCETKRSDSAYTSVSLAAIALSVFLVAFH